MNAIKFATICVSFVVASIVLTSYTMLNEYASKLEYVKTNWSVEDVRLVLNQSVSKTFYNVEFTCPVPGFCFITTPTKYINGDGIEDHDVAQLIDYQLDPKSIKNVDVLLDAMKKLKYHANMEKAVRKK